MRPALHSADILIPDTVSALYKSATQIGRFFATITPKVQVPRMLYVLVGNHDPP